MEQQHAIPRQEVLKEEMCIHAIQQQIRVLAATLVEEISALNQDCVCDKAASRASCTRMDAQTLNGVLAAPTSVPVSSSTTSRVWS